MTGIAFLLGIARHYSWGGTDFIPSLLQVENPNREPYAEYWLGVHPLAPGQVEFPDGKKQNLNELIENKGSLLLGEKVQSKFGNIPYLLKVLDVKDMLSIQVHPSKVAAEAGFKKENETGVPLDAPNRNYKDPNHKPELLVALGDFWLLHGFRAKIKLKEVLQTTKELNMLVPVFENGGYKGLFQFVMTMGQKEVNAILQPLLDRIIPLYHAEKLEKSHPDFWAARAAVTYSTSHNIDRGIFSIYFFNLLHLEKGEGIFQEAGVPHAYLEGKNVEIMANSDNVLRGGLTPKHVDVEELMKHIKFEGCRFQVLNGDFSKTAEKVFQTSAPDFQLSMFALKKHEVARVQSTTAEMILLIEGSLNISDGNNSIVIQPGRPVAIAFAGTDITLESVEDSLVFRATVPVV